MKSPLISVVMSVYKEPIEWLHQSIDSILNQTLSDFEFIIVCDNPDYKEGIALLKEYAGSDSRIVLLFNDCNIGLTKSLNRGLNVAKGEYIARMDADDISVVNRLEKQVNFLNSNIDVDICHTNISFINNNNVIIVEKVIPQYRTSQDFLFWHNIAAHPTVMFRYRILSIRSPLYNETFSSAQDYELWTFVSSKGYVISFLDEILLEYRVSSKQISAKKMDEQHANTTRARKIYIYDYLKRQGIIDSDYDKSLKTVFEIINEKSLKNSDIEMCRIKYILYYNLAITNPKYIIKYFLDKQMRALPHIMKDDIRILFAPLIDIKHKAFKL